VWLPPHVEIPISQGIICPATLCWKRKPKFPEGRETLLFLLGVFIVFRARRGDRWRNKNSYLSILRTDYRIPVYAGPILFVADVPSDCYSRCSHLAGVHTTYPTSGWSTLERELLSASTCLLPAYLGTVPTCLPACLPR
jgi:hypothetical protein